MLTPYTTNNNGRSCFVYGEHGWHMETIAARPPHHWSSVTVNIHLCSPDNWRNLPTGKAVTSNDLQYLAFDSHYPPLYLVQIHYTLTNDVQTPPMNMIKDPFNIVRQMDYLSWIYEYWCGIHKWHYKSINFWTKYW